MTVAEGMHVIREFVRGERDSSALTTLGASLELGDDTVHLDEPADAPVYDATASDVAVGLLANWAVGSSLRDWARVLLATGMVDLSSLEDDPRGDTLLNALWDAAEGSGPSDRQLHVARQLAGESG
jgi:hypothetical protein